MSADLISTEALMRLHVEALFTMDPAGRLLSVNEPGGAPAPRFFLGGTVDGNVWAVRHDLEPTVATELLTFARSEPVGLDPGPRVDGWEPFLTVLARDEPVHRTWSGPAFRFPAELPMTDGTVVVTPDNASVLTPYLEDWLPDVRAAVPMTASLEDGRAVSICCSVRLTDDAHEAGVETHPSFRGRGHAGRAVVSWAAMVRDAELIPLYGTSWENESSRTVARKLGLIQYGGDFHAN